MSCKILKSEIRDQPPCESKKGKIYELNHLEKQICEHRLRTQFSICRHWILVLRSVMLSQDLYWLAPKPTSSCRRNIFIHQIMINYLLKRKYLPRFSLY